ncbi:hypothetical protein EU527_18070 [Candidatus Thorarchaeota archaeon]|nr:MAG: hypothetical protein EU527_18070 [Candidatus Thorarchaeota archaeon]
MSDEPEHKPMSFDDSYTFLERVREHLKMTQGAEIARRYLAMNAFDGVLPVLGIIMGGLASLAFQGPIVIFQTSLLAIIATTFSMFISGITSSYLTEGAERRRDIQDLEKSMLTDLGESGFAQATRTTVWVVSLINGLSPFLAGLLTASPLFLVFFGLGIEIAFLSSIVTAMFILFLLGFFLGKVSRSNVIVYGLKTLGAGIIVMAVIWFISVTTGF